MDKYSFNIFWSEEDNSYFAICPEFPGLSAFGDTPEQALAEGKIVLEITIETYKEEGLPLPEPDTAPL
ncbi:MAG TPA: type II toxin-antitoxin system HicB family antitoxin [Chloroflexia bacterium]|jgi:predicted RNase H-like HicB family nuclease|nr:type II toxin-antitoxin system HicB family antitoxin [Chloroflexia bacterium]